MGAQRLVVVRVHEIALKGRNRPLFERQLVANLRAATAGLPVRVRHQHMRITLALESEEAWPEVRERLAWVFGAVKYSLAFRLDPGLDLVRALLQEELPRHTFSSFRITARRGDKSLSLTSLEINRELGAWVQQLTGARVDLTHPELTVFVELLSQETLVYFEELPGPGGLPVGVSGRVVALLSGGIDSPVAAWYAMKRGCRVTFAHFHSFPLVEGTSREKAADLVQLLTRYQYHSDLYLFPFAPLQQEMLLTIPAPYRLVLYRRFMLRIAEALARQVGALALVTGESLGQVSSQTLPNLATIQQAVSLPVLRPLIGMDKVEIIRSAQALDTYPISIIPDQDCCTLFVPRSPATRASLQEVLPLEEKLDVETQVQRCLAEARHRAFTWPSPEPF